MRHATMIAAALAATLSTPLQAGVFRPDVPAETGVRLTGHVRPLPSICSDAPVRNRYHGALYDRPPAVYLGYAYRPYYRYAAWRVMPRRYFCTESWR